MPDTGRLRRALALVVLLVATTAAALAVHGPVAAATTAVPTTTARHGAAPSRQLDAIATAPARESTPSIRRAIRSSDDGLVFVALAAFLALVAAGRRGIARIHRPSRQLLRSVVRGRSPPLLLAVH